MCCLSRRPWVETMNAGTKFEEILRPAVLVAGGAGYIGSHVCKALAAAGLLPVTLDNLSSGHRWAVRWGPLVVANIGDEAAVAATVEKYGVVAALHFAALSIVPDSVRDPMRYYDNNLMQALAFARALVTSGVARLVFSSTAAVYGVPTASPIPEEHVTAPINPYGNTKLAFERALRDLGAAVGLRWVVLRYFNAAGADLAGEIGEAHDPETHLIPNIARTMLGLSSGLKVFGADYPTRDGTALRDYIHVTDLAEAHVSAVQHLLSGGENLVLNAGTSEGVTVAEVLAKAAEIQGKAIPYTVAPRRPGDPPSLVADARSIGLYLGWKPRHSDLDTIVRTAFAWHATCFYRTLCSKGLMTAEANGGR